MSDKVKGKQIKMTASAAVDELVKNVIAKALGDSDVDNDNSSDDNSQFVTPDQMKIFGTELTKSISEAVSTQLKTVTDTLQTLTKSKSGTDGDSGNVADDKKSADGDKTDGDKTDGDLKGIADTITKTVDETLKKLGFDPSKSLRKSYVLTSDNKLLKNVDGALPDGATEIDPNEMDQDAWDNVPKNIQNQILRSEMKRRIFSS